MQIDLYSPDSIQFFKELFDSMGRKTAVNASRMPHDLPADNRLIMRQIEDEDDDLSLDLL